MNAKQWPALDAGTLAPTRDALHAYARVLGNLLKGARTRRKHWWHASLRPAVCGLSTGVVHGAVDAEVEIDMSRSALVARTARGASLCEPLEGQPAAELEARLRGFLAEEGFAGVAHAPPGGAAPAASFPGYSAEQAGRMGLALGAVASVMAELRAGIREEASPIQIWPHHFDLSMLWLPGVRVPGVDPDDEEFADAQMNFGFAFGDVAIAEPYFYTTAYPLPDGLTDTALPHGARWNGEGFTGALLTYGQLLETSNPSESLLSLWKGLLAEGRERMTPAEEV